MKEIKSKDIEIRLNMLDKVENCSICNDYDEEFELFSNRINYPNLFLSNEIAPNSWVCRYCADSYTPQLRTLLTMSRTIERYELKALEKSSRFQEIADRDLVNKIAIKIDITPKDIDEYGNARCAICRESYFYEEISEYEPIPPNLILNGEFVCNNCGEKYVPRLAVLASLSYEAKFHCDTLYFENDNPEINVKTDKLGWITYPNCKKRFSTRDYQRWRYNRHLTCGQKTKIVFEN